MPPIFQSFLPWIIFIFLSNYPHTYVEMAAALSLVVVIVFRFSGLLKRFLFDWFTLLFFSGISALYFTSVRFWLTEHAALTANTALAGIMLFSLIINRPFTSSYAKLSIPEYQSNTPQFRKINWVISSIWTLSVSLMAVDSWLLSQQVIPNLWIYDIVIIILFSLAILFSIRYPNWYFGRQFKKASKKLENIKSNPYMNGNYAAVQDEIFETDLKVKGKIPDDLLGVYMRNGPNPQFHPISYTYPIDGDGMIHAVYLREGKASYRNRFIETKGLLAERRAGKALYGGISNIVMPDPKLIGKNGDKGPTKNGAFVHVIRHAKQYIALMETSTAYQISSDLLTVGEWTPKGMKAPPNVNAHTRLDPKTQQLHLFTYNFAEPEISYYILNKQGEIIKNIVIEKEYSTMIHDFVITEHYIIFFDGPAIFDMNKLATGEPVLSWQPQLGTRIGVMKKKNLKIDWIDTETFFVYHFANAYEDGERIIVNYTRHESLRLGGEIKSSNNKHPCFYQTRINLSTHEVAHEVLDHHSTEFPRINDNYNSMPYQYSYMVAREKEDNPSHNAILKYDSKKREKVLHLFGDDHEVGEPVFAPKLKPKSEDDGYIMLFVYNKKKKSSCFVILDAKCLDNKPLAEIQLPRRVPHGLHGSWMPGEW